jgi:hypothetical protein
MSILVPGRADERSAEHEGRDGRVLAAPGAAAMRAEIETGPGEDHIVLRRAVRHRQIGGCGGLQRSGERDHADASENVPFH